MCGIAGWVGNKDPLILEKMISALHHRGPDAQGQWCDDRVNLGHARLRIIDLNNGAQPMLSKKSALVFNGEIYNYKELKETLSDTGPFYSDSDTEVLQRALETWGHEALKKIRGMFAFAFYDLKKKSLLLARDPVGQKPLFYSIKNNTLIFASTCKSLRQHPGISDSINRHAMRNFLINEAPRDPETFYEEIQSLAPGHSLHFDQNGSQSQRYWDWPLRNLSISEQEESSTFETLFDIAVKRRLQSDVPLGVFLSGGLDSSAITWQVAKHKSAEDLYTFSIGFEEKSYDESSHSQNMASIIGSQHHHHVLSEKNLIDIIPKALSSSDQPLADGSLIPFYLLCEVTKKKVTVALSGDGADDLMAGYDPFKALSLKSIYQKIPMIPTNFLQRYLEKSSFNNKNLPLKFKLKQFLRGVDKKGGHAIAHWMSAWKSDQLKSLMSDEQQVDLWKTQSDNEVEDAVAWFRTRYLNDQILTKVDRGSMAHSLEVRSPFLDQDLLEFVSSLPSSRLDSSNKGKGPLRRWAKKRLPESILNRKKKGFGMPISQWMKHSLKDWVCDSVTVENLKELGLNEELGIRIRDQHLSGQSDNRKELWTLSVLCHWLPQR